MNPIYPLKYFNNREVAMNQLELLWLLESQTTLVERITQSYNKIKQNEQINLLEKKISNLNRRIDEINNSIVRDRLLLKENYSRLKEYNYTIENMRKELYSGSISDLRQLDYLNREKDKLSESINLIETDILISMDETEKMEVESIHTEEEITSLNANIEELKLNHFLVMKEFQEEMQKENLKLIEMESGIDEKLLNRFTNLRNSRQTSVVPVKNNICTGCNMRVPTYLNKILKSKEEVIFCESCGRILYYTENLVE